MISVVIPSYNRRDCVLALLADLRRQEEVEFEVIVVDDQSPDDSVEAIRNAFPEVKLLVNEKNGGPAVTRNRGFEAAQGDIVVGFDSDVTLPDPQVLAKTQRAFAENPEISGLAFRIFEADGTSDDVARWWHPVPWEDFAAKEFFTSYFSGTAYAFRKDAAVKAGLYPEILYMHYEEVELAFRIWDEGVSILYLPELTAVHHANPVSRRSQIKVFYKPRNQVLITLRCYSLLRGCSYLIPRLAYGAIRSVMGMYPLDWLRAMGSALRLTPACLRERKAVSAETWGRIDALPNQEAKSGMGTAAAPEESKVALTD